MTPIVVYTVIYFVGVALIVGICRFTRHDIAKTASVSQLRRRQLDDVAEADECPPHGIRRP